jgi:endoglucanase
MIPVPPMNKTRMGAPFFASILPESVDTQRVPWRMTTLDNRATLREGSAMPRLARALRAISLALVVAALTAAFTPAVAAQSEGKSMDIFMRFLIRQPDDAAIEQIWKLLLRGQYRDAELLVRLETVPQAVWLTGGTPAEITQQVRRTLLQAKLQHAVPVFVPYNIPGRDCGGYSAGGAQTTPAYTAWIDAIAGAIRSRDAIVILEPDALANLPSDCGYDPTGTLTADRYAQLSYAISAFEGLPRTRVYLDAGHSKWHSVGTIASRLVQAGLSHTQGFYLNVSNYQPTDAQTRYGTWISKCIAFASDPSEGGWRLGHYDFCASQYFPANADDYSTWSLTDDWYASNLSPAPVELTHFIIDTSRNGRVHATNSTADPTYATEPPGRMTQYSQAPYNQSAATIATLANGSWCNQPGSGAGKRPTTVTGTELVDAYLWVKTLGESDGQCNAAGGVRAWDYSAFTKPGWPTTSTEQANFDPLWGRVDPAAGAWFPEQALELARLAVPAL